MKMKKIAISTIIIAATVTAAILPSFFAGTAAAEKAETDDGYVDVSLLTDEEILSELASFSPESINEINFINCETGACSASFETLCAVKSAFPEATLDCSFELFGVTVSSEEERIEFDGIEIGNEGVDTFREAIPLMNSCRYLLIADCGIDYELLSGLRDDFPEKNVVWRVHIFRGHTPVLTDITLLRTTRINDEDAQELKYCRDVKYVDVGHTESLTDISFVRYMPNLETLIIALTGVEDISAVAECRNLKFLELFGSKVSDLSALSGLINLEQLNMSDLPVTDISPLYGLTNLKRLRIKTVERKEMCPIPQEQLDTITRLLPDCEMMFEMGYVTYGGWRYIRRQDKDQYTTNWNDEYLALREQMKYDKTIGELIE